MAFANKWYPPGTLFGPHWAVEVFHVVLETWVTYTEHTTLASAEFMAQKLGDLTGARVTEVLQ